MNKFVILLLCIIAVLLTAVAYLLGRQSKLAQPQNPSEIVPKERWMDFSKSTIYPQISSDIVEEDQKPQAVTSSLKESDGIVFGIEVTSPAPYTIITSPVTVSGRANVFEGHVNLRVKDQNGIVLGEGFGTACMDEKPCPFTASVTFTTPSTTSGTVEAYTESAADGSIQDLVSIPVSFGR